MFVNEKIHVGSQFWNWLWNKQTIHTLMGISLSECLFVIFQKSWSLGSKQTFLVSNHKNSANRHVKFLKLKSKEGFRNLKLYWYVSAWKRLNLYSYIYKVNLMWFWIFEIVTIICCLTKLILKFEWMKRFASKKLVELIAGTNESFKVVTMLPK